MQLIHELSEPADDGSAWLSITGGERVGYLLRGHGGSDGAALFDQWFTTVEDAEAATEESYGSAPNSWHRPDAAWVNAPPPGDGHFTCPVCYFPYLDEEAWIGDTLSVEVCPSCGTQFDDAEASGPVSDREQRWVDLRDQWIIAGAPWHSTTDRPPRDWPPPAATLT